MLSAFCRPACCVDPSGPLTYMRILFRRISHMHHGRNRPRSCLSFFAISRRGLPGCSHSTILLARPRRQEPRATHHQPSGAATHRHPSLARSSISPRLKNTTLQVRLCFCWLPDPQRVYSSAMVYSVPPGLDGLDLLAVVPCALQPSTSDAHLGPLRCESPRAAQQPTTLSKPCDSLHSPLPRHKHAQRLL